MSRKGRSEVLERLRALVGEAEGRLPAERTLAAQIGCSRETLRAALAVLEQEGAIWRHVGQGTFAGPPPRGHLVREQILIEATSPAQLMQARLMIEPPVAAHAARAASSADLGYLRNLVEEGRCAGDRRTCEEADARFHRGIAEVAGNPVLLGVLDYLAGARRRAAWQREWERTYRRLGVAEFTGAHSAQHGAIVAAIAARDPSGAEAAMRDHLQTIEAAMRA
ncbi:FadR/GntR family transcriptional regulator [Thioclava atlantica]|uniref:FadR/GntR family transcriptional regulator n=1 Tax=Thioclava atlantica TaxID=1317124 RepID=UPI00056F4855|nr:FCD domain-containing protein [Thioclava atlantica]